MYSRIVSHKFLHSPRIKAMTLVLLVPWCFWWQKDKTPAEETFLAGLTFTDLITSLTVLATIPAESQSLCLAYLLHESHYVCCSWLFLKVYILLKCYFMLQYFFFFNFIYKEYFCIDAKSFCSHVTAFLWSSVFSCSYCILWYSSVMIYSPSCHSKTTGL